MSSSLGLSRLNANDYECKRISPDKFQFTVPAMPNDIPSKMSDAWWHEGTYTVTFTYYLQNNSQKTVTHQLSCVTGNKKSYDLTIPEDVGNFTRIDMKIEARDGMKDQLHYYWDIKRTISKNNCFSIIPYPSDIRTEYQQFEDAVELQWNTFNSSNDKNYTCLPYVYRIETDDKGNALSGQSWEKRKAIDNNVGDQKQGYTDQKVQQNTYYKYLILNVPKEWTSGNAISATDLNSPTDKLLNRLGYTISGVIATNPSMKIYAFQQDTTVTDKVKLTWQYERVPVSSNSVTFQIHRRPKGDKEWVNYGNVTADANPKSGAVASFTDNDLPDNLTAYEYKVVLPINNGKNQFIQGSRLTCEGN